MSPLPKRWRRWCERALSAILRGDDVAFGAEMQRFNDEEGLWQRRRWAPGHHWRFARTRWAQLWWVRDILADMHLGISVQRLQEEKP